MKMKYVLKIMKKYCAKPLAKFDNVDAHNQPSTSSSRRCSTNSVEQQSPDSPIARIAKRNALILNGLDLSNEKRGGAYVDMLGILPDLNLISAEELDDKYPAIGQLFRNDDKLLDIDTLHLVQHEVEDLISQNLDYQKTIHGEITYLTTGDYPTTDLANRPMPKFDVLKKQEQIKLKQRAKHNESTASTSLADLGILSSPEDDDAPNILDVPNRFWTWAKGYLRPISKDYVREYKERIFDRFDENSFLSKFVQPKVSDSSPPHKGIKRKAMVDMKSEEQKTPMKISRTNKSSESIKTKSNGLDNSGGMTANGKIYDKKSPPNLRQNGIMAKTIDVVTRSPRGKKLGFVETPRKGSGSNKRAIEEPESTNGVDEITQEGNDHISPSNTDEVLTEIEKKQEELNKLYHQTRPLIKDLYGRILRECAVHDVSARLDTIDNTLCQLGSKYQSNHLGIHIFNKEQRQEIQQALSAKNKLAKLYHVGGN